MKVARALPALKALCLAFLAAGSTWAAASLLDAGREIWPVLGLVAVANILFFVRARFRGAVSVGSTVVLAAAYTGAAFIILLYVIVIPFSSYLAWIGLVRAGRPGGIISFLFVSAVAFFASLLCGSANRIRPGPALAAVLLVVLFETAVIWQTAAVMIAFVLCAFILILMLAAPGRRQAVAGGPAARRSPARTSIFRSVPVFLATGCLALIFSLAATPETGLFETRHLDPAIKRALFDAFPDLPDFASLGGQGFALDETALGEKPRLSGTPLFRVQSARDKIVYLRTTVSDTYLNNAWSRILLSLDRKDGSADEIWSAPQTDPAPVTVTVLFDYLPVLPHRLSAASVRIANHNLSRVASGSLETGFSLTLPLLKGDDIVIGSGHAPSTGPTSRLRDRMEQASGVRVESQAKNTDAAQSGLLASYRAVPATLSARTKQLARDLGRDETRPWMILKNIHRHLADTCAFSLKTESPPRGAEFIDHFLFVTRKGHAAHFATAFVVLARLNGIPARYVRGFIVCLPEFGETAEVTGLNAHAWPEVWIPELGWTTMEASPVLDWAGARGGDYYTRFNRDRDDLTARQLEAIMGQRIPPPVKPAPTPPAWLLWLAVVTATASAVVAILIFCLKLFKRMFSHRIKYHGARRIMTRALRRLVETSARLSIASPEETGWCAWAEKFKRLPGAPARRVEALVALVHRSYFSPHGTDFGRARYLKRVCAYLVRLTERHHVIFSRGK